MTRSKFGESIEKVALTYDESSSTLPEIVISESVGSWGMPITVPIQSGKRVLANSSLQIVVEGLADGQNYSMRGNLLTYDKNNLTWSNVNIYTVSTYLGHASDLMLADGFGGVTTLVKGYSSRYLAKDTSRNSAPLTNAYQVNVDEVGDVVLDAADITDIDGDISTWHWEYLSGPYISFLSPNEATSDAWIGSTNGNSISTVRLTVSDLAGNQSTSVISLNIKETITNNDNSAPLTSSSVKIWGGKTKYKNATLSVNENPVLTYWKYSGEDLFNGGGYVKDKWYLYDSEISFKLVGAGGRMYYYSVDRSGNIETEQSVKIGGKGK